MPAEGYLQVHAFTSDAQIPLPGVAIAILDDNGMLLAARITNSSGQIRPVTVSVPDRSESLDPNFRGQPFTTVNIRAQHPNYEQIQVNRAQVFAGITTLQPLAMIPTPLYPDIYDRTEYFNVPPQNL